MYLCPDSRVCFVCIVILLSAVDKAVAKTIGRKKYGSWPHKFHPANLQQALTTQDSPNLTLETSTNGVTENHQDFLTTTEITHSPEEPTTEITHSPEEPTTDEKQTRNTPVVSSLTHREQTLQDTTDITYNSEESTEETQTPNPPDVSRVTHKDQTSQATTEITYGSEEPTTDITHSSEEPMTEETQTSNPPDVSRLTHKAQTSQATRSQMSFTTTSFFDRKIIRPKLPMVEDLPRTKVRQPSEDVTGNIQPTGHGSGGRTLVSATNQSADHLAELLLLSPQTFDMSQPVMLVNKSKVVIPAPVLKSEVENEEDEEDDEDEEDKEVEEVEEVEEFEEVEKDEDEIQSN